jgi:hypothetical protein
MFLEQIREGFVGLPISTARPRRVMKGHTMTAGCQRPP